MDNKDHLVSKFVLWIVHINIMLLLIADRYAIWHHTVMLLPWALVLSSPELRTEVLTVARTYAALTMASVLLTLLISIGCLSLGCSRYQFDAALVPILWLAVAAFTRSSARNSHRILFITVASAVLAVSGNVLWQFFIEERARPRGLSFNVLTSPMLLAMLCLLNGMVALAEQWRKPHVAGATVLLGGLGVLACICTRSKTGLLTFVVGTIAYMLFSTKRLRTLALAAPIIAIWLAMLTPAFQQILVDASDYQNGSHVSSAGDRTDGIRWGTEHMLDMPWLGMGDVEVQRRFNLRGHEWKRPQPDLPFIEHLHNDYLQIAVAYGIPALLCFLSMWAALIARAIQARSQASPWHRAKPATPWMLAMSAVYLPAFGTDSFSHWIFTWATVTCCLGIAAGLLMQSPHDLASPRS
jgi:O-antigen ligase